MIDIWLCWCVGIVLMIVGLLTAIYLIALQMRKGATGLSVLSTSDTLALTVIGVLFIANGLNTSHFITEPSFHNGTLTRRDKQVSEVLSEECDFKKILMGYGIFLAPFLNAFISMLAHAVECYHDIVRKTQGTSITKPSSTEDVSNSEEEPSPISDEPPRRKSLGSDQLHLHTPTLVSELQLVKQHVTEITIESNPSTSHNDVDGSKPSSSKTIHDMDVFHVSKLPKQKVGRTKPEGHVIAQTSDNTFKPFKIRKVNRADFKSYRRLVVSLLSQWLLPILAILILFTSKMEEHSFDVDSRIDETTCYVDNIASALRISPECIDQLRQESFIKSLLSKPMPVQDNSQIINRYSLNQRNKAGEIDRITSMIIRQVYRHVDEFNKTRRLKTKRLKKLPRGSNLTQRTLWRKIHQRQNVTGLHGATVPHLRTLVKPNYDINLTRAPTSMKNPGLLKKKDVVGENVDASAGYYDELPADYEENEDETEDENGSEGVSGEAMSDEITVKPSPPTKSNTNKDDEDKITYDEVVSEEGTEPEEDNTSESSLKAKVTTQRPQNIKVPSQSQSPELDVPNSEKGSDEETSKEVANKPNKEPQLFPKPNLRPTTVSQEFTTPSSINLDSFFDKYPISLQKNSTLGGYLVQNIEEFSNIKICVKKCSISSNFMKGYLFAVLFLGYFIPIIVAVVIYIVIVKNVNTTVSEQVSKKVDSENNEDKDKCTDMSCIAEIVKQFIMISIVMWTPTFLEMLLRTWFCVRSPSWVTMILFILGQVHGIVRNFFNMKLVKANTKGEVYKGLCSGIMRRNDGAVCPSNEKSETILKEKLFKKSDLLGKFLPKKQS